MADSNHDELLSQFTDITGATAERATFFLESANWQLQVRSQSHFTQFQAAHTERRASIDIETHSFHLFGIAVSFGQLFRELRSTSGR